MKTEQEIWDRLKSLKEEKLLLEKILSEIELESNLEFGFITNKVKSYNKEIYVLEWVADIDIPF